MLLKGWSLTTTSISSRIVVIVLRLHLFNRGVQSWGDVKVLLVRRTILDQIDVRHNRRSVVL